MSKVISRRPRGVKPPLRPTRAQKAAIHEARALAGRATLLRHSRRELGEAAFLTFVSDALWAGLEALDRANKEGRELTCIRHPGQFPELVCGPPPAPVATVIDIVPYLFARKEARHG